MSKVGGIAPRRGAERLKQAQQPVEKSMGKTRLDAMKTIRAGLKKLSHSQKPLKQKDKKALDEKMAKVEKLQAQANELEKLMQPIHDMEAKVKTYREGYKETIYAAEDVSEGLIKDLSQKARAENSERGYSKNDTYSNLLRHIHKLSIKQDRLKNRTEVVKLFTNVLTELNRKKRAPMEKKKALLKKLKAATSKLNAVKKELRKKLLKKSESKLLIRERVKDRLAKLESNIPYKLRTANIKAASKLYGEYQRIVDTLTILNPEDSSLEQYKKVAESLKQNVLEVATATSTLHKP